MAGRPPAERCSLLVLRTVSARYCRSSRVSYGSSPAARRNLGEHRCHQFLPQKKQKPSLLFTLLQRLSSRSLQYYCKLALSMRQLLRFDPVCLKQGSLALETQTVRKSLAHTRTRTLTRFHLRKTVFLSNTYSHIHIHDHFLLSSSRLPLSPSPGPSLPDVFY